MWCFSGSNVMSVGPFLVPSKTLTFFVFKKRSSGFFRLLCQCWLLSTNINIIKRTNAYCMYTNSTKTNIIKQSIPYYCIQEKFEIPRVLTRLETCRCYCFFVAFLTLLMQRLLAQKTTNIFIATDSPLFYLVLNISNTCENSAEPQFLAPNQ